MPQQIVYTDDDENKIVEYFAEKWGCSKADTIKRMIQSFEDKKIKG